MARVFPHQLFVLLSLVSSSCNFLSPSAHAPSRQSSFRSRHAKHGGAGRELFSVLKRWQGGENQSALKLRTNSLPGDCENDCGTFGSPSQIVSTQDRAFRPNDYDNYFNSGLDSVDGGLGKISEKHLETVNHRQRNKNAQEDGKEDDNAFRYPTTMFSFSPSKSPRGRRSGAKKPSLENFSQQSQFPFERTLREESIFLGTDFYSDGPGAGESVVSPGIKWEQGSKDLLSQFSKYFSEGDTLETEPSEESALDFKLWNNFVGSGSSQTDEFADTHFERKEFTDGNMNADTEIPSLGVEDDTLNTEPASSIRSVLNLVDTGELDDETTDLDGDVSDQNTWSSMTEDQHWMHLDSLNTDTPFPEDTDKDAAHWEETPGMAEPSMSKRFSVPLHKKVFFYGHDDRLKVFLPQMRKFPFSNIARLSTGCTGTLVTPRHVLTAAHCVHNGVGFRNNLEKLKIEIPDTMGFKDYYAQKITIPTGWLRENRSKPWKGQSGKRAVYDYAVVRLKLGVAGRTKFLPLAVPRPEVLQMDFHFLAFPQDDQQLWRSVCLASQHMALGDGNLIMTRCDAAVGNSGAAVFIKDPHGGMRVVGILSNTMHVGHHRSFYRYSIITALTWPKLTDICNELGALGRKYNVCPPVRYMRRSPNPPKIKVIPFFGKRSKSSGRRPEVLL